MPTATKGKTTIIFLEDRYEKYILSDFHFFFVLGLLASCGSTDPIEPDTDASAAIFGQPHSSTSNSTEPYYYTESAFLQMGIGEGYCVDLTNIDENGALSFRKTLINHAGTEDFYLTISTGDATTDISTAVGYYSNDDFKYANSIAYDKETGNYYALFNENQATFTINTYDKSLNLINEGTPYEWVSGNMSSRELHYFDGKLYFLSSKCKLYINNIDGASIDIPSPLSASDDLVNIWSISIDRQGNLYFLGEAMSGSTPYSIGKYDLTKDELVYQKKISNSLVGGSYLHYNETENCLYVADDQSIYRFVPDESGEQIRDEQIVIFGEDTSFIPGLNLFLRGFISDSDGNFFLAVNGFSEGENFIYKLSKKYGEKNEDYRKEIVLTASYKQDFMVDAINRYNAVSENYKVVFDTFYENRDEYLANNEAGRTKLITKILTNDTGDIIATGGMGLDILSIFQTDVFVDLRDYIENDPTYSNLSQPVLNAITINDSMYGLPIGHLSNRMVYNKDLGDDLGIDMDVNNIKWSDMLQYAHQFDAAGQNAYVFQGEVIEYLEIMLNANLPDLIDVQNKKVNLNQQWFLDLMQDFKDASKLEHFCNGDSSFDPNLQIDRNCLFGYSMLENAYIDIREYLKSPIEIQYIPSFSGEQNHNRIAYAFIMYSISNSSENKEAAWDFLSFLLGEDIETLNSMHSTALNTKSHEKIYSNYEDIEALKEQYAEIASKIDTLYDMGAGYKYDVFTPMYRYLNDELTLEQAIEEAEYSVWLRLNE